MPSAKQYIKLLQKDGVMLVIDGELYFIPLAKLGGFRMPGAFQKGAKGVNPGFFQPEGNPKEANPVSLVYRGMMRALADVLVLDGVNQAVWVQSAKKVGKRLVSKAGKSQEPLFCYSGDGGKIVVDMTKGGRPSDS